MTADKCEADYPVFIKKGKKKPILILEKQARWSENLSGVDNLHMLLLFIRTLKSSIFNLMNVSFIHLIACLFFSYWPIDGELATKIKINEAPRIRIYPPLSIFVGGLQGSICTLVAKIPLIRSAVPSCGISQGQLAGKLCTCDLSHT